MCYPSPAPRCSSHAQQQLTAAEAQYEANPNITTLTAREEARHHFNLTPAGIKALREAGETTEADRFTTLRQQLITRHNNLLKAKARSVKTPLHELTYICSNRRNPLKVRETAVLNLHKRHPVFSTFPLQAVKGMLLNPLLRGVN